MFSVNGVEYPVEVKAILPTASDQLSDASASGRLGCLAVTADWFKLATAVTFRLLCRKERRE